MVWNGRTWCIAAMSGFFSGSRVLNERNQRLLEEKAMENNRPRAGWSAIGMVGLVFFPIGLIFLGIGLGIGAAFYSRSGFSSRFSEMVFLPAIFVLMGLLFAVLGAIFLIIEIRRRRGIRRVFESGYSVKGTIAGYHPVMNVTINGRHPYVLEIHVHHQDTGTMDVYQSRYLSFVPDEELMGSEVDVYIDRMGGKDYYVDIDAILPKVIVH